MIKAKQSLSIVILFLYVGGFVYQALFHNTYNILFMDERIIIDDIYNQWFLFDRYNRFEMLEDGILKQILIFIIEFIYGGDLRYGRIWSNLYSLLIGPFVLISNSFVITAARILNIIIFLGLLAITKLFVHKKDSMFFLIFIISIPGSHYLLSIPKPDILALVLSLLALHYYKKQEYGRTFFLFGLAFGSKVTALFIFVPFLLIYFTKDFQPLKITIKHLALFIISFFIANPILIVPPIFSTLPNFQKLYFSWITSQATWGQQEYYQAAYSEGWLSFASDYLKVDKTVLLVITITLLILAIKTMLLSYSTNQYISFIICLSGSLNLIYILFFVERNFPSYLFQPIYLLCLSFIIVLRKQRIFNLFSLSIIIFFTVTGSIYNINKIDSTINELPNQAKVNDIETVLVLLSEEYNYLINPKNAVAWDPTGYIPRNNVTYTENFEVLEHWGGASLNELSNIYDFYVSDSPVDNSFNFKLLSTEYYFVYYLSSR